MKRAAVVLQAMALACLDCGRAYSGGYGGGGPGADTSAGNPANVIEVSATDAFAFEPAHLTVAVGTTVRWINRGAIPHTVTSGASSRASDNPGAFLDGKLPSGGTVEVTLSTVGDWPYFCRYHEGMGMVGLVTVTADPQAQ
jgi:plastocyanin